MLHLSTQAKAAVGYIVLTVLLFTAIFYINHEMNSMVSASGEVSVAFKCRRATNEIAGRLYDAEVFGQSLSLGKLDSYPQYEALMNEVYAWVDSLYALTDDSVQFARLDSVRLLLDEKNSNTKRMVEVVLNSGTDRIYRKHIERLVEYQDSVSANVKRMNRRVTTETKTTTAPKKKRGFFRRLKDVFSPPKADSVETIRYEKTVKVELADSLEGGGYNPADSVAVILKKAEEEVASSRRRSKEELDKAAAALRLNGLQLNQKVRQMLSVIEEEEIADEEKIARVNENIRRKSAYTVGGIAIFAVVLAAVFLVLVWRDIARSNRYKRELEAARAKAENLLEVREKLMLAITHDIKAPVGSIMGYAELLERIATNERERFYIDSMRDSSKHLLNLVTSLLDYHRLEANKMEVSHVAFNPAQLLTSVFMSFRPMAEAKGLGLSVDCGNGLAKTMMGDPFRIRQIVENLLSNALKFTQEGGICLSACMEGDVLNIGVKDTGCGMSEDDKKLIFKEFTRLESAQGQEGFGLGLSITMKLVRLLNGDISVDSEAGKGSVFKVSIPLKAAEQNADAVRHDTTNNEEISSKLMNLGKVRILMIDDDRIQLRMTEAMLNGDNVAVTCCESPGKLLEWLDKETFDIVLTDIQMPAMNGFDLLKKIRSRRSEQAQTIPVIAVTARSDMDKEYYCKAGFATSLNKPFTRSELINTICGVMGDRGIDVSGLVAFADGDAVAAKEIVETFKTETRKNLDCLAAANENGDSATVSAIAHKMIPTFKMLHADKCVGILRWLEANGKDVSLSDETKRKALEAIELAEEVLRAIDNFKFEDK